MQATATATTTERALARVRDQLATCREQLDAYAQCRHGEESYHDRMREAMMLLREQDRLLAIIAESTDDDESPECPESDDVTCLDCGESVDDTDCNGHCEACAARHEARQDAIGAAEDELSTAEDDIARIEAEMAELLADLADARKRQANAAKSLKRLGTGR